MSMRQQDRPSTAEDGAVMILSALLLVVLLAFAALAVDLGALWAERRSSQSAADAAVMAGGLEYVASGAASSAEVVDIVRDYVSRNIEYPPSSQGWLTCTDPTGMSDGFSPMTDSDGNDIECISLKQGDTGAEEFFLRVKLPDRQLETFFAKVIGINSLNVNAFAEAEIKGTGQFAILPLSVPQNYGSEECLGSPPSGQLKDDETSICTGSDSGNFGLLDSPFFEDHTIAGSTENGCHAKPYPNFNTRAPFSLAAGLDHAIQEWAEDGTIPFGDLGPKPTGADTCDADTEPEPEVPYILRTGQGNRDLIQGMIGPGLYDGKEGRLRQNPNSSEELAFNVLGSGDFRLDNVGLWEYLVAPSGTAPSSCYPSFYDSPDIAGRAATDSITDCLEETRASSGGWPEFSAGILISPRFALVPVLSYERGDIDGFTGTEYRAVVSLVPIYIQTTWYDCGSAGNKPCYFEPDESGPTTTTTTLDTTTTTTVPTDGFSILFNPGEGATPPQVLGNGKDPEFEEPKKIQLDGFSALVLEWDWLVSGAKNQLGEVTPLSVTLYR